jgi:hypothetical protein
MRKTLKKKIFFVKGVWSGGQDFHEVETFILNSPSRSCYPQLSCDSPVSVAWAGWVMPTMGRLLQHLRKLALASKLGSSARLSYRPTKSIRMKRKDLCVLALRATSTHLRFNE